MEWIKRIDDVVAEKHLLNHAFYTAWTEGRLSIGALRGYSEQYYKHVSAFPRYISAIHTQTPDLETRQYLLENLIDEERGAESHPELWLRFAEGIGATREDVRNADAIDETLECDRTFREITTARGSLAGLAALYAYESQVPAVAQSKIDGLKTHYGIDDEQTLSFFSVHLEVDTWHAERARELLASATPEEQDAAVQAASDALDALNLLLDGVVRAHCPEVAAA
ncbi:MAG TPA: CADD family putative folate metabolism protein [Actinomycetota bacterium]|nr:CADD family putative folate metabolism protein [Actinomycetota bacterium]